MRKAPGIVASGALLHARVYLLGLFAACACSVYDASMLGADLTSEGGSGGAPGDDPGPAGGAVAGARAVGAGGSDGTAGSEAGVAGSKAPLAEGGMSQVIGSSGGLGGRAPSGGGGSPNLNPDDSMTSAGAPPHGEAGGGAGGDGGGGGCREGDCCPADAQKTEPGLCGCGKSDADGDGDQTPDCRDGCPADAKKTAPGQCGCGVLDQDASGVAGCLGLKAALVHRYAFGGSGTEITDSVGSAHGSSINATLSNKGSLTLAGSSPDQYVDLPNGLISALTNASLEVWLSWGGGEGWQRIFDFGNTTSAAEGVQGEGQTHFVLTPRALDTNRPRALFSLNGASDSIEVEGPEQLPVNSMQHIAVVVNDSGNTLSLYCNGELADSTAFTHGLSDIEDLNVWLGRSQFANDPGFVGSFHEFRIYNRALSQSQVMLSAKAGPDPAFLSP